jgi:hypothetical protein
VSATENRPLLRQLSQKVSDPYYYVGSEGVNFLTWAISYALFDD